MSAKHLRRFDLYPNRGIDHPFKPRGTFNVDDPWQEFEVKCRLHGIAWTQCELCSPRKR